MHWAILFSFTFLVSLCGHLSAQQDSLQLLLEEAKGEERLDLLLRLSNITRQQDPEKAIDHAKEALALSKEIENKALQSRSLRMLGYLSDLTDRDTTAMTYYLEALKLERKHGNRLSESDILQSLGRFYANQGNITRGLDYYFQALEIRQKSGDKNRIARTLNHIGAAYADRQEYDQAVVFFKQAFELGKELNSLSIMASSGTNTAVNLGISGDVDEATHYFEQALKAAGNMKPMHSVHARAGILLSMSDTYQEQNFLDEAMTANQKLLDLAKKLDSKVFLAKGFENLADLYTENGDYSSALDSYLKSLATYRDISMDILPVTGKLMNTYMELGQTNKAIQTGENALELNEATREESLYNIKDILNALILAYNAEGEYQKAFQSQDKLLTINQQIYSKEKTRQIAEMQTRYETRQKEQEIALLEQKQEKSQIWRNALLSGIILMLIIGFLIYNRQRLKISKNKTELENIHLQEKQLLQDLEFKNKQLTTHSLHMVQKNETLKELQERIANLQSTVDGKTDSNLRSINQLVNYSFNLDKDWDEFRCFFEEVHTGYFDALKSHCQELTPGEIRLSALLKLNMTSKEIATILGISPDSVKTARYRMRKKLGLETEENLVDFLNQIEG